MVGLTQLNLSTPEKSDKAISQPQDLRALCAYLCVWETVLSPTGLFYCVAAGFDLMEYFNVRDILGTRADEEQSSYVRLGTMPIVQQTEWVNNKQ